MDQLWHGRRELRELRARVDQAFRLAQQRHAQRASGHSPAMDLAGDDNEFVVTLDLPGISRESLDVRVDHGALLVTGEKPEPEQPPAQALRRERDFGTFSRVVPLPDEADLAQVSAKLAHGELVIRIGRKAQAAPRRIDVVVE
jgi:HSP20 family protein